MHCLDMQCSFEYCSFFLPIKKTCTFLQNGGLCTLTTMRFHVAVQRPSRTWHGKRQAPSKEVCQDSLHLFCGVVGALGFTGEVSSMTFCCHFGSLAGELPPAPPSRSSMALPTTVSSSLGTPFLLSLRWRDNHPKEGRKKLSSAAHQPPFSELLSELVPHLELLEGSITGSSSNRQRDFSNMLCLNGERLGHGSMMPEDTGISGSPLATVTHVRRRNLCNSSM
mmetsp:Transcript_2670/g.8950  ORF Transcript_2670/g.8950 Transcript_2670/m.8950 type:complete len:223 (-) Transcript_2670:570-1238(-)